MDECVNLLTTVVMDHDIIADVIKNFFICLQVYATTDNWRVSSKYGV